MKLDYTYEIINVDESARSMEIVYTSPIHGVLHVGARLPWKGETLEQIVYMYNPTAYWLEQTLETEKVDVGASGTQSVDVYDRDEDDVRPSPDLQPEKISLSKLQAFYSLASFGLLAKADSAVREKASFELKTAWRNHSNLQTSGWTVRACAETVELQRLLGLTRVQMDDVFVRGYCIDPLKPKDSIPEGTFEVFDNEVRIWELKTKLEETDYVALTDYGPTQAELIENRKAWREEIRVRCSHTEE